MPLTLLHRLKLVTGLWYRCRCGAIGRERDRAAHERFHDMIREWLKPPSAEEMALARVAAAAPPPEDAP
jgi:hypothetical protein